MFEWIGNAIWGVILKGIWHILIQGPLNLIAVFNTVLEYLTGGVINDLLFGSSKEFDWNKIPAQFWWFVIVAICIFSLVFVIQIIILLFQEASETKTKFVLAIQNAIKAFAFMFLIPIFFFLANFIVQSLANTVINNFGDGNSNIAKYLWHMGDPNWDGTANGVPSDYGPPSNINDYNIIAQLFGTWFMAIAMCLIGLILIQKIVELFFLFIISPLVMIVMVIDNGKAAFTWKDMVIAKFLASTATLISYYIFISVIQILIQSDLVGLKAERFARQLFLILFFCGGGLATIAFCDTVANFVGEGVGIREGRNSLQSTFRGGLMALGLIKGIKTPYNIGKNVAGSVKRGAKKFDNFVNKHSKFNKQNNDSDGGGGESNDEGRLNGNSFRDAAKNMATRSGIDGLKGSAFTDSLNNRTSSGTPKTNKPSKKSKRNFNKTTNPRTQMSTNATTTPSTSGIKNLRSNKNSTYPMTKSNKSKFYNHKNPINNNPRLTRPIKQKPIKPTSPRERYRSDLNKKIARHQNNNAKKWNKKAKKNTR
ncbi:MAG: hypothetical protein REH79_02210 [Spiroplasma sp.]|nr:hypothetical protein [Spiroplasma sp.]